MRSFRGRPKTVGAAVRRVSSGVHVLLQRTHSVGVLSFLAQLSFFSFINGGVERVFLVRREFLWFLVEWIYGALVENVLNVEA